MVVGKACKNCRYIVENETECPNCQGKEFTEKHNGQIYIFDTTSQLAQKINANLPGKYAVRVKQ